MTDVRTIKVAVVHEDDLLAAGLRAVLGGQHDIELVEDTASAACAPADVVVSDYEGGLRLAAAPAPRRGQAAHVLVLTQRDSEREIRHALSQGVRGYVTSGGCASELLDAVRRVGLGIRHVGTLAAQRLADSVAGTLLTEREMDVLRLLMDGACNKGIARRLEISHGTVKSHMRSIFQKLDAHNRTEVVVVAEKRGLLASLPAPTSRGQGPWQAPVTEARPWAVSFSQAT